MEPSGRVFILGAGASVFAGFPLATELPNFLRQNIQGADVMTRDAGNEVLTKLQHAEHLLRSETKKIWDFETLLTHLGLYGTVGNLRLVHGEWSEVDEMKVAGAISYAFMWQHYMLRRMAWDLNPGDFLLTVDPMNVKLLADAWADFIEPGDVFISFNWDLVHEAILWRAKKWSYIDGYGFPLSNFDHNEQPSKSRIYKLHGSVNWVQEDGTSEVQELEHTETFFPGSHPPPRIFPPLTASWDRGRKLILPTYLKDVSRNRTLLRIWRLAQDALRNAREILVIGYSLNPADHPARLLFGTELGRNTALGEVVLISPSMGGWAGFDARIQKTIRHVPKTFEQWLRPTSDSA